MSNATPIDEWALDQPNDTGISRAYTVHKIANRVRVIVDNIDSDDKIVTVLYADQARALATLLLYAADLAEGKHG